MFKIFIAVLTVFTVATAKKEVDLDDRDIYFDDEIPCEESLQRLCLTANPPQKFPETEEELQKFCDFSISYLRCAIDYGESCSGATETIHYHMTYLKVLVQICRKNSPLHTVVVDNLQCYSKIEKGGPDDECVTTLDSPEVERYIEHLAEEGLLDSSDDNEIEDRNVCVRELLEMACYAVKIEEECGRKAMNAFLKILHKLRRVLECAGSRELVTAVIRRYKIEKEELDIIMNVIKKK